MKKANLKKMMIFGCSAILAFSVLAGCGSGTSGSSTASSNGETVEADGDVTQVVIGTGNAYKGYCYIDEDGNPAGFDVEIIKAIDEALPQYEFTIEQTDFASLWTSLEAGKYDAIFHQIQYNDERGEKYLYSEEYYSKKRTYLVVLADSDITSYEDFAGTDLTLWEPTGNASLTVWQKWNEENPDKQINVVTTDNLADDALVAAMQNGTYDACVKVERDVDAINDAYGSSILKVVGEPVTDTNTYVVYRKDDAEEEQLKEAIDGALQQLREDGTLKQLSIDQFGKDYTE